MRKKGSKKIPQNTVHYLPLIPRIQQLYALTRSTEHMMWHYKNFREEGVLCHPSDGESWKIFDWTYVHFPVEPRHARLGLYSDDFTHFSQSGSSYSCWRVIIRPLNFPHDICKAAAYIFLTLIISVPNNSKNKICIDLQLLIDELRQLWKDGVFTYDMSKKHNFFHASFIDVDN